MTDLRNIQQTELKMLKMLKKVCEKNDIDYFMAQGTLLGAVRHKGFIPWDDDIDTLVPYDDIKRLVKAFNEEYKEGYIITNHNVEKNYPSTWTKIRKSDTTSMPIRYKDIDMNWGICIDVFPFYPVSDVRLIREGEIFLFKLGRKLLMAAMTKYDDEKGFGTKLVEKIPSVIRRGTANMLFKIFDIHKGKNTRFIYLTCKGGRLMERDVLYGEKVKLWFEDDEYSAPRDYHRFLEEMFGDYMIMPPEEERGGHEKRMGDIIWDCDKSYRSYKQP